MNTHPQALLYPAALFALLASLFVAAPAHSGIVEKETARYFTFKQSEYPLDADGRLSDSNAREILLGLKRIYDGAPPVSKEDFASLQDIRDNLHRVYAGEVYEEMLLTCLKAYANHLVYCLETPSAQEKEPQAPSMTFDAPKDRHNSVRYYGGRLVRVNEHFAYFENKGGGRTYFIVFDCTLYGLKEKRRGVSGDLFSGYRVEWNLSSGKDKDPDEYYVDTLKKGREGLGKEIPDMVAKAIGELAAEYEKFVQRIADNANRRAVVFEEQWNPLLDQIPRAVYARRGTEYAAVIEKLASQLVTTGLQFMTDDKSRKDLEKFATESHLDYKRPKATGNKLF